MNYVKNNKIKLLVILFLIINISAFANENIVDLKFKKEEGFKRFYLSDEAGNVNYGFFEFNSSDPNNTLSAKDITSDQFRGLTNLILVGDLFECQRQKLINIIAMSSTYGVFAATMAASAALLTLGLTSDTVDDTSRGMLIAGGALLFFSSVELIVGSIFLGRLIYFIVNYNRTKKEILNELNKVDTYLIKLKNIKIRFSILFT